MDNKFNEDVCYVATEKWMPGIVKLGKTQITKAKRRIARLWTTAVPEPFEVEYAVRVEDRHEAEKLLFGLFAPYRIHPKREFFQITVEEAKYALRMLALEDVTDIVRGEAGAYEEGMNGAEDEDMEDVQEDKSDKLPALDFNDLNIPVGSTLMFVNDKDIKATVTSGRSLNYNGEDFFPSKLTGYLLGKDYAPPAGPWWVHEGRLLQDIYDEVHKGKDKEDDQTRLF